MDQTAPIEAFRFAAPPAAFATDADGRRRVEGVAYSGDVITSHWYWSAIVFDLSGIEPAQRIPLLVEHDRSQRVGFTSLVAGTDLRLSEGRLLKNPLAQSVASDADDGFPWQLSVHIEPISTEDLRPGEKVTVNGREVHGPCTVFRQSRIREVSFTPTGVDHNTSARVFSSSKGAQHVDTKELEAKLSAATKEADELRGRLAAAEKRAEAAESAHKAAQLAQRTEDVKSLFAGMGRTFSDEAAKPYIEMDGAAFAIWKADMSQFSKKPETVAPKLPNALLSAGPEGTAEDEALINRLAGIKG